MENINFIPANELPATEAEEVEVLCLENGELKRKPASGLGGAEPDMTIRLTVDAEAPDSDANFIAEVLTGTYDAVKQRILAGLPAIVRVMAVEHYWNGDMEMRRSALEDGVATLFENISLGEEILEVWGADLCLIIQPDNTVVID